MISPVLGFIFLCVIWCIFVIAVNLGYTVIAVLIYDFTGYRLPLAKGTWEKFDEIVRKTKK